MATPDGPMQSRHRAGEQLADRLGIHGRKKDHLMNRRKNGTVEELEEWIKHYKKVVAEGKFCPKRGAKIIDRFEKILERKR